MMTKAVAIRAPKRDGAESFWLCSRQVWARFVASRSVLRPILLKYSKNWERQKLRQIR
jgi:hypothetical protein